MILVVLRALFVLLMVAAGWYFLTHPAFDYQYNWLTPALTLTIGVLFIAIDILAPRKKLQVFSGTFLGLVVGVLAAYALSFTVFFIVDLFLPKIDPNAAVSQLQQDARNNLINFINLIVGIVCCYLAISFILQTKDDFRFIVPYVEFSRQVRGARPILIDTSVIIDGRIIDIAKTGILESRLIVPRFVLEEMQTIADNGDRLKRNRGRRGLDVLNELQNNRKVEVFIYDWSGHSAPDAEGADQKLLVLAKELHARLLTIDFNFSKVAQVRGVDVININDLAGALRPAVLPGEKMQVRLVKAGEEPTQGIGFLDDGTMVVVEQGRPHLNQEVEFTVTNVLQTAGGRMIFGRIPESPPRKKHEPVHDRDAA